MIAVGAVAGAWLACFFWHAAHQQILLTPLVLGGLALVGVIVVGGGDDGADEP